MGMNCPKCKAQQVIKNGRTPPPQNKQKYKCNICGRSFVERAPKKMFSSKKITRL